MSVDTKTYVDAGTGDAQR